MYFTMLSYCPNQVTEKFIRQQKPNKEHTMHVCLCRHISRAKVVISVEFEDQIQLYM